MSEQGARPPMSSIPPRTPPGDEDDSLPDIDEWDEPSDAVDIASIPFSEETVPFRWQTLSDVAVDGRGDWMLAGGDEREGRMGAFVVWSMTRLTDQVRWTTD